MAQATDPVLAAVLAAYHGWANEHERKSLQDERSNRPIGAAKHRQAARRLRAAATNERVNPPVETWNP